MQRESLFSGNNRGGFFFVCPWSHKHTKCTKKHRNPLCCIRSLLGRYLIQSIVGLDFAINSIVSGIDLKRKKWRIFLCDFFSCKTFNTVSSIETPGHDDRGDRRFFLECTKLSRSVCGKPVMEMLLIIPGEQNVVWLAFACTWCPFRERVPKTAEISPGFLASAQNCHSTSTILTLHARTYEGCAGLPIGPGKKWCIHARDVFSGLYIDIPVNNS